MFKNRDVPKLRKINSGYEHLRARFARAFGYTHSGRRDLYEVFGYSPVLTSRDYYNMYRRGGIANRIVRAFPKDTWAEMPLVRDEQGDSPQEGRSFSAFVQAFDDFAERTKLQHYLERADRLAGIASYGLLVMGFNDGKSPAEPLEPGKHKLIYLQPFSEVHVTINKFDENVYSPRFGLPETYTVNTGAEAHTEKTVPGKSFQVHHTRCIHLTEFPEDDNVYGTPRLMPVYNYLQDLEKTIGGSAETFWLCANRGLALIADPEAPLDEDNIKEMKKQADEFYHQIRRTIVGTGITASSLGSDAPDPGPNVEKLLDLIAGTVGIPKRILIGSERGELSSSQDETNWSSNINTRRRTYASPMFLRPFINLMIETGNLPEPQGLWWPEWPDEKMNPEKEANVANAKASALATYSNAPEAQFIVPVPEFRSSILGLPPESDYELPDELPDAPDVDPVTGEPLGPDPAIDDPEAEGPEVQALKANAKPRPFYACRPVLNAKAILRWAQGQGFKDLIPASELHVTICRSTVPVDWMAFGADSSADPTRADAEGGLMIQPGGVRIIEKLGNEGAICLLFTCDELHWRHQMMRFAGADWDWESYQPHITLTYAPQDIDLDKVEPYTDAIALGPELIIPLDLDKTDDV